MILKDIVEARASLQKLISQDLPLPVAYRLYKLVVAANEHLTFYGQELAKGRDKNELDSMVIDDIANDKLTIVMTDNILVSANDVKNLEPLINFCEGVNADVQDCN